MYYIGLFILGWMLLGLLYWVYIIYIDQDWERMQEEAKSQKQDQEGYDVIMKSKKNFLVFCLLVGACLAISEILFEIKFWSNKLLSLFKKNKEK